MLLALWSIWQWGDAPALEESGGGAGGYIADLHEYRKQLNAVAKAADARLFKKIEKLEKIERKAPPEVKKALKPVSDIDYSQYKSVLLESLVDKKLNESIYKLDLLIKYAIEEQSAREAEEELILLMAAV